MYIELEDSIIEILKKLKSEGFESYVVGGYIRDKLLGIESFDVDITTSAPPFILKKIFSEYNLNVTFINLGSVKFIFNGYNFEITTFRKEFEYINNRKPSKIEFVDNLLDDLKRRDFTINALCSDGINFVDAYGGVKDLENKSIMTIGDPQMRFKEDALRILRAIRFSSKLGFDLSLVDRAIINNYKLLNMISFQRKNDELKGILQGKYYISALEKYSDILKEIFNLKKLDISLFNINMSYEEKEALFFYFSDNKIANKYLINKDIDFISDKIDLKKKIIKYGYDNIFNTLFFRSNFLNLNKEVYGLFNEIVKNKECYNLKTLNINGKDLLNLNIENNKIGKILNILLYAVIENKCQNEKKTLLKYLENNILD